MFGRSDAKKKDIYILRTLESIQQELLMLKESVNKEKLIKKYDHISVQINLLNFKIKSIKNFVINYGKRSKYNDEICNINVILEDIRKEIEEIGTNIKKDILDKLNSIDEVFILDEVKVQEIQKVLKWVWEELKLEGIEYEDVIKGELCGRKEHSTEGKLSYSGISARQIVTFKFCLENSILGDIESAVHSLFEFVENYEININKPFTSFERISIRIMITDILAVLVNEKVDYLNHRISVKYN